MASCKGSKDFDCLLRNSLYAKENNNNKIK